MIAGWDSDIEKNFIRTLNNCDDVLESIESLNKRDCDRYILNKINLLKKRLETLSDLTNILLDHQEEEDTTYHYHNLFECSLLLYLSTMSMNEKLSPLWFDPISFSFSTNIMLDKVLDGLVAFPIMEISNEYFTNKIKNGDIQKLSPQKVQYNYKRRKKNK